MQSYLWQSESEHSDIIIPRLTCNSIVPIGHIKPSALETARVSIADGGSQKSARGTSFDRRSNYEAK
uniref:Uncharacterized protein n=1 Tax=Steinernema glaseri TaxID=37863 RepID=A0A1I7ZYB6_9BILA